MEWFDPPSGQVGRIEANLAALRVLRGEDGPGDGWLGEEDRKLLARWSGWGAVPQVFDPAHDLCGRYSGEMRELMSDDEYGEARLSTINAHYTSPEIAGHLWELLGLLGGARPGEKYLEPGCGHGVFMSAAPEGVEVVGVEREPLTAAICEKLHPSHTVVRTELERFSGGGFDGAVGNVPFSKVAPFDSRLGMGRDLALHNYALAKALDSAKAGGLVVAITSRFTMDAGGEGQRRELARWGQFLGSIRLPTGAFRRFAGTDVVVDAVVFARRPSVLSKAPSPEQLAEWGETPWLATKEVGGHQVNEWFLDNPDMVLGEIGTGDGLYGSDDLIVTLDASEDVGDRLAEAVAELGALARPAADAARASRAEVGERSSAVVDVWSPPEGWEAPEWAREGSIFYTGEGFLCIAGGEPMPLDTPVSKAAAKQLRTACELRDATRNLVAAYAANSDDVERLQARLGTAYESALQALNAGKKGDQRVSALNEAHSKSGTRKFKMGGFSFDPDYPLILGLERELPDETWEKAAVFTESTIRPVRHLAAVDSLDDALVESMGRTGGIDLALMREIYPQEWDSGDLVAAGLAFVDPATGALEAAPRYLGGNVRAKLAAAREAAEDDAAFAPNVAALEAVVPPDVQPGEIEARCGTTLLTVEEVTAFVEWAFGPMKDLEVTYTASGGWGISATGPADAYSADYESFGTDAKRPIAVMDIAWSGKTTQVTMMVETIRPDGSIGEKEVGDPVQTQALQEQVDRLHASLNEWMWNDDPERCDRFARRWNEKYRSWRRPEYPAEWVNPPGLAAGRSLYEHQAVAAAHVIAGGDFLLGHAVGGGKTATMGTIATETRRLGIARKPALIVPNHLVAQTAVEVQSWYPEASVLIPTGGSTPDQKDRASFAARCALGDWDLVVLPASFFDMLPVDPAFVRRFITSKMNELRGELDEELANTDRRRKTSTVKRQEQMLLQYEKELNRVTTMKSDDMLLFDDMGIDFLMVDEAHFYKNLEIKSANRELNTQGSKRATSLEMKLAWLRQENPGRAVTVLATGTPVANKLLELAVMARYVMPETLEELGLENFDSFVSTFCRRSSRTEVRPMGRGWCDKERITHLINADELRTILSCRFDIRTAEDLGLARPELVGGQAQQVVVDSYPDLEGFFDQLEERAKNLSPRPGKGEDNMLSIVGDARHASLGLQAVGLPTDARTKVTACAEKVAEVYHANADRLYDLPGGGQTSGAFQLVFCDLTTPGKSGRWSAYEDLRAMMAHHGVPFDKIEFIHDHDGDAKEQLFRRCRRGDVSVLVGSTEKMGTGTNVQSRLVALHHLDFPWRPCDVEQREGRILRPGNQNPEVEIFSYIQKGSGDTFMLETLQRKAEFINSFLSLKSGVRTIEDTDRDSSSVSFADMKAAAFESPLHSRRATIESRLGQLRAAQSAHRSNQARTEMLIEHYHRTAPRLREAADELADQLRGFGPWTRPDDNPFPSWVTEHRGAYEGWDLGDFAAASAHGYYRGTGDGGLASGSFGTLPLAALPPERPTRSRKTGEDPPQRRRWAVGPAAAKLHVEIVYQRYPTQEQLARLPGRIEKLVADQAPAKVEEMRGEADRMDAEAVKAAGYLAPFPDQREMDDLAAELAEVEQLIAAEDGVEIVGPAERDPAVEVEAPASSGVDVGL